MASDGIDIFGGVVGSVVSKLVFYPIEGVESRQRVDPDIGAMNFSKAAWQVARTDGIAGLYAGLSAAVLGDSLNRIVYFSLWCLFGWILREITSLHAMAATTEFDALQDFFAGVLAGACASAVMNPIWVI